MDEVEILRGQIQLLHHQLLYERHKCDQHATRNRRLIGKTFKAVQHQEELLAIVSSTLMMDCDFIKNWITVGDMCQPS